MLRLTNLLLLAISFQGCSYLQERLNDPAIVENASKMGKTLNSLGQATGIPYAGYAAGLLGVLGIILFSSPKKKKEEMESSG